MNMTWKNRAGTALVFVVAVTFCASMGAAGWRKKTKDPESYGCVFIIDGLRGDMARKYADEGLMPNLRDHFLERGVWVEHATTVFPTITGAAIPSLLTGAYPGRHNRERYHARHDAG